ncbi:MAG: NADPH-dependent FMN reductase [Roseibium sp.]
MKFLAVSGSGRQNSTNTELLRALARVAPSEHSIHVYADVARLPVFTPDLEDGQLPDQVQHLTGLIRECDGVIVSSPEYVRSIPGGLKNAIDWLVSRDEIISEPIILLHASHRGDDMLDQLRTVLSTVSDRFNRDVFARFDLIKRPPEEIPEYFQKPGNEQKLRHFLRQFVDFCLR